MMSKLEILEILVNNPSTGEQRKINLPVISGKALIKKRDVLRYFNVSSSTVNNMVKDGSLQRLQFNGQHKTDSKNTGTYFDLNQLLKVGSDRPAPKVLRYTIKKGRTAGEGHATKRQPK